MSSVVVVIVAIPFGAAIGALIGLVVMGEIEIPDLLYWLPSHRRRAAELERRWLEALSSKSQNYRR
jgi:hypothetical protein